MVNTVVINTFYPIISHLSASAPDKDRVPDNADGEEKAEYGDTGPPSYRQ